MSQTPPESEHVGAAHTFIVRLRREPGNAAWRMQVLDVHSGAATALSIAPNTGEGTTGPFAAALAVAIERLLGRFD
jgi:hypothetical protein